MQRAIATRLGWLEAPFHFADETGELRAFAAAIREQGFTTAVLGGMGGSSLAPALLTHVFGTGGGRHPRPRPGLHRSRRGRRPRWTTWTRWRPCSSSPRSPARRRSRSRSRPTSGRGLEEALEAAGVGRPTSPGDFMVAITDPDRSLRSIPHHDQLREVFLNPPDVGGRYSALTYVGLVPGALLGIDLDLLLEKARAMVIACGVSDPSRNPGLALGLAMGAFAAARARQADLRHRPRAGRLRAVGRAADRREHGQARRRRRAGRRRAARRPGRLRRRPRLRPHRPGRLSRPRPVHRGRRRRSPRRLAAAGHPRHPHRGRQRGSTSAPSSSAGRSPPRSPAPCWGSTRSTSPTSRKPRRIPAP